MATSRVQDIIDLFRLFSGESTKAKQVTSGGSSVSQTQLSDADANKLVQSLLSSTQGLASVTQGQKTAGLYNSTVNTQLANDLLAKVSAEVAAKKAPTVTTKAPTTTTTTQGKKGPDKLLSLGLTGLGMLSKNKKLFTDLFDGFGRDSLPTEVQSAVDSGADPITAMIDFKTSPDLFSPALGGEVGDWFSSAVPTFDYGALGDLDLSALFNMDAGALTDVAPTDLGDFWLANGGVVSSPSTAGFTSDVNIMDILKSQYEYVDPLEGADIPRLERLKTGMKTYFPESEYISPLDQNPYFDLGNDIRYGPNRARQYWNVTDDEVAKATKAAELEMQSTGDGITPRLNPIFWNSRQETPFTASGDINPGGWHAYDFSDHGGFWTNAWRGFAPALSIIAPAFGGWAGLLGGTGSAAGNIAVNAAVNSALNYATAPDTTKKKPKSQSQQYAASGGRLLGHDTKGKDSFMAHVGGGEMIIPTDVVDNIGEDFFNSLISMYHKPI